MLAEASSDPHLSIVARVAPGGVLLRRWRLTGGVSAAVEALSIGLPGGGERTVVLRRPGGGFREAPPEQAASEHALLVALFAAGLPVPEPLLCDPSGFLVMAYVEGGPAPAEPWSPMADFLVHLHALDPDRLALPPLPRGEDPLAGARAVLDAGEVRSALDRVAPAGRPERLLHGDFWTANVLWRDGAIAAVVDWEGASLGDPMADVACGRIELSVSHGPAAADAFVERYAARAAVDRTWLAVWELYASGSALASLGDWGLPPDVEARRRVATERAFQAAGERLVRQTRG
jgi:aminoglycoside phosphotransferase (APT) family kinase protein